MRIVCKSILTCMCSPRAQGPTSCQRSLIICSAMLIRATTIRLGIGWKKQVQLSETSADAEKYQS